MTEFNWSVSVERTQRLAAQIKRVQGQLRAERRRLLQQYGEFVERAGLTALPPAALFGLLLEGARQLHDAATVQRWHAVGSHTLALAALPERQGNGTAPANQGNHHTPAGPVEGEQAARPTASQPVGETTAAVQEV
jgi:hypothetical protein